MIIFFHTTTEDAYREQNEEICLLVFPSTLKRPKILTEDVWKIRLLSATLSYPRCVQKVWRNDM